MIVRFGIGRLPDVHRLEVRAVGVGVADALHDRQLPLLPQRPEALHAGVQADVVVQADDHVLGLAQRGPGLVVEVVGVGNDGVEAVVAAGHLETTRMLSLPGAAACAVRATNCGTTEPRATSDEPCKRAGQELPTSEHAW